MRESKNDMADLFRATFHRSGLSLKRVADEAQVPYASVHGFLTGDRDPAFTFFDHQSDFPQFLDQ